MGLAYVMATRAPVLDTGWRVGLYPAGTSLAVALAAATSAQAAVGRTVDPATAVLLPDYYVRGTADTLPDGAARNDDDHGWRNTPRVLGTVCLRYRVSGPGVHNP
jgi:hypothetical protein